MKTILCLLGLFLPCAILLAQTPLTSYSITNVTPAASVQHTARGQGSQAEYKYDTVYNCYFGQRQGGAAGRERVIQGFTMAGNVYTKVGNASGRPYSRVKVNRHPSLSGNMIHTLYEHSSIGNPNNYFEAAYKDSLENVLNDFVCNRGSDNLFSNPAGGASTTSSIERIDLFLGNGVLITNAAKQGILVNERNGNDNFKAAAITAVNAGGNVTALGTLLAVPLSAWGKVGPDIYSTVLSRSTDTNLYLKPKQNLNVQRISGMFISFANLGLSNGATVYGVSIFPDDVTAVMNLVSLSNVPINTSEGSVGGGGIDLMAGGGYFVETTPLSARQLKLTGAEKGGQIILNWTADADMLNGLFQIERQAANGWVTKTSVSAAGTSQLQWTDPAPPAGPQLYRVSWVGPGGGRVYSNEARIILKNQSGLSIYPNPVYQVLTASFTGAATKLVVSNTIGAVVKQTPVPAGVQALPVSVPDLPNGSYFIELCNGKISVGQSRFVKQE